MGRAIAVAMFAAAVVSMPAAAQDPLLPFSDGAKDAKIHAASGYMCPRTIGHFERDAVGAYDPETSTDFCAYSARDGVYGTIMLRPLVSAFDAKALLAPDFAVMRNTGGRELSESEASLTVSKPRPPLGVYARSYETSSLEDLHYRSLLAVAPVGGWVVEVTLEYAAPRDDRIAQDFLNEAYKSALADIRPRPPATPAAPPLAQPPGAR